MKKEFVLDEKLIEEINNKKSYDIIVNRNDVPIIFYKNSDKYNKYFYK